jgi:site-specific DNA-methyltransferase (adenine-specific)
MASGSLRRLRAAQRFAVRPLPRLPDRERGDHAAVPAAAGGGAEGVTPELRFGPWQEALRDIVEVDAVITDPPFSARTADGFRGGDQHGDAATVGIPYGHITNLDVRDVVASWAGRTRWWFVVFSDHILAPIWSRELDDAGWYTFAPVPWVKNDGPPRFMGDGPASSTEWITVARRRVRLPKERIASRPGFYRHNIDSEAKADRVIRQGGKPILLMRKIVRDYTLPGDRIADPFSGGATTLLAAAIEGRKAVGAERDPATFALAQRRLANGWTPAFDFGEAQP